MNEIKMVELPGGVTVPEPVFAPVALNLSSLLKDGHAIPACELMECSKDTAHKAFGYSGALLVKYGLAQHLNSDGTLTVHDDVKKVVLALLTDANGTFTVHPLLLGGE